VLPGRTFTAKPVLGRRHAWRLPCSVAPPTQRGCRTAVLGEGQAITQPSAGPNDDLWEREVGDGAVRGTWSERQGLCHPPTRGRAGSACPRGGRKSLRLGRTRETLAKLVVRAPFRGRWVPDGEGPPKLRHLSPQGEASPNRVVTSHLGGTPERFCQGRALNRTDILGKVSAERRETMLSSLTPALRWSRCGR
jgi:hypothetical protein